MITGKLYDRLKFLAQVGLPAFATLYFALAGLWGLPGATQVVGTVVAFDTFLGVILQISSANYSKAVESGGELHIAADGQKLFKLDENQMDIDGLGDKKEVRFKVVKNSAQ